MMMSPGFSFWWSSVMTPSVGGPAGTMTQMTLGDGRAFSISSREVTTVMSLMLTRSGLGSLAKPVTWWPPLTEPSGEPMVRRRAMFPPILPRPMKPMCMVLEGRHRVGGDQFS